MTALPSNAISLEEYRAKFAFDNEAQFTTWVITLARANGWLVTHFRPARTKRGWRTAGQGDCVGFPDLVLVGGGKVLFRELKVGRGRMSSEQTAWLQRIAANGGDAAIWRPSDYDAIVAMMEGDAR